ncbi:ribonuclease D [Adlercreutzia equolifaciens]|uniref:Ribonuclease D n=2 Tax=Adlercreutzia TaxID=447020 RepID=A0A7K1T2Y9_9ACTN|nr:ribonuclease D [Adlercreutzia rubneri]MVN57750.1 ribonuclease D [Adlercreutzia rubneri]
MVLQPHPIQTRTVVEYIASQENLEAFVRRAASSSVLAIDTEFLREKTYYANLCLIQLATDTVVAVVDPFAIEDLKVLAPLLSDPSIVKLFHAGGQDLEILYRELGVLPAPLFDTQVAATLLGHTQQIGYGPLVHSLCGVNLKKSDSFTDWSRRPLSASQLEYAADDVIYLPKMYRIMVEKLESKGRLHWLDNDFAAMSDPANYESDPSERYKRLKRVGQLTRRQLSAAREVACWREVTAQERDMPRKWVLTDEQIVEACRRESRTIDDLFLIRGVREKLNTRDARAVATVLVRGLDAAPDTWPELDKSPKSERNVDAELDLMEALVRLRAKENDIAMQTLASRSELARVARGYTADVDVLRGWRRAMVGDELLELLAGRLALSLGPEGLVVTPRS